MTGHLPTLPPSDQWEPGSVVTQEEYFAGHAITIRPVTVVADEPSLLALYTAAGSTQIDGTMRNRSGLPLEERMRVYALDGPQPLHERPSRWHVVSLTVAAATHSFKIFWKPDWEHFGWYIDFHSPYQRTETGIRFGSRDDSHGLGLLDLFVTPDLEWNWKDRDEFDAAYHRGWLTAEERDATLTEAAQVINRVERSDWPLDEQWPDWRPDPRWDVPHLALTGPRSWRLARPSTPKPAR